MGIVVGFGLDLDAMFVGTAMHGLVGVMNGDCLAKLDLQQALLHRLVQHVIDDVVRGPGAASLHA